MLDDNELIQKFQNGDEKAFDQLVRNNLNNVFGFFMKVTRDEMSAEDLTQDVFMKLYTVVYVSRRRCAPPQDKYGEHRTTGTGYITFCNRNFGGDATKMEQAIAAGELIVKETNGRKMIYEPTESQVVVFVSYGRLLSGSEVVKA